MAELHWVVLSAFFGFAALVAVSLERRTFLGAPSGEARRLLPRLRSEPDVERRRALVREACPPPAWEAGLARALDEATSTADRIDAASEASWALATRFASRASWGSTGIRIGAASGFFLAVLSVSFGSNLGGAGALLPALVGAALAFGLQSTTRALERSQRELADEIVRLLVPEAQGPRPGRGRF